jgi:pimeloyl-ACP methyl ester carboxylesterase
MTILFYGMLSAAAQGEPINLTITALPERNLLQLTWEQQPGVEAWCLYRSPEPLFEPTKTNHLCTVTDSLFYDSLTTPRAFYQVVAHHPFCSVSAVQRDLVLQPGEGNREYFSSLTMAADSTGISLQTILPAAEREQQQPAVICWRDNGLAAWNSSDSLLLNQGISLPRCDPWTGLDNGRRGLSGGYARFSYTSFAISEGWQISDYDSLLILEKDTLRHGSAASMRLVIDLSTNLLRQSEVWQSQHGLVSRYQYRELENQLLLRRREQFSYKADSLQRIVITEFSEYNLNAAEITYHPADLPPTPTQQFSPCSLPPDADEYTDWSACSLLSEMENMSNRPRPEATDCAVCHTYVPPRGVLLLHGINSNPTVFNLIQDRLESRYDCFFFRPHFSNDFTAVQMRDSLAARLERLGDIQWIGIGHSLGGLVGRDLLQRQEGNRPIQSLITIGSPHNGANLVNNIQTARGLFDDLRDDIEDLASLDLIDWLLGSDLSQTFQSLESYCDQIESCTAFTDLHPESIYIARLQQGNTNAPFNALACNDNYQYPIAELYAGLAAQFTPPYPYGQLDQTRNQLRNDFISTWNNLESLTWNFRFIDQVNDIHWDLVTMNNDWNRYVLDAEYEWSYPLYEYHEDNDCFYCPRPPFCGNGREWCCHESPQDPDGARFWCCFNCGADEIVCYLGDASTTIELPNDGLLSRQEQTWYFAGDSSQVVVSGVSHLGEKASDLVLERLESILDEWGME